MRKEVEGLRTIAAEAVEEAERGLVKAERLLKDDANAAVLRVREKEEAKQGGAAAIAGLCAGGQEGVSNVRSMHGAEPAPALGASRHDVPDSRLYV